MCIRDSCNGCSDGSAKVERQYTAMLRALGPEFYILREAPLEDIRHAAGDCVAEVIRRLRLGPVSYTHLDVYKRQVRRALRTLRNPYKHRSYR